MTTSNDVFAFLNNFGSRPERIPQQTALTMDEPMVADMMYRGPALTPEQQLARTMSNRRREQEMRELQGQAGTVTPEDMARDIRLNPLRSSPNTIFGAFPPPIGTTAGTRASLFGNSAGFGAAPSASQNPETYSDYTSRTASEFDKTVLGQQYRGALGQLNTFVEANPQYYKDPALLNQYETLRREAAPLGVQYVKGLSEYQEKNPFSGVMETANTFGTTSNVNQSAGLFGSTGQGLFNTGQPSLFPSLSPLPALNPISRGGLTGGTSTGGLTGGMPSTGGAIGNAFPSVTGFGGGASGGGSGGQGMALEGKYGLSAGNSSPFPIRGDLSVVKMAQGGEARNMFKRFAQGGMVDEVGQLRAAMGGEVSDARRMLQNLQVQGFAKGGEVSEGLKFATQEGGIGAEKYYQNIRDFFGTNPGMAQLQEAQQAYGVSDADLEKAMGKAYMDRWRAPDTLLRPDAEGRAKTLPTEPEPEPVRSTAPVTVLPPAPPLPELTEKFVPPTAPLPEAPPAALTPGQEGLDPGKAIVGKIPEAEQVKLPQLDTTFRASEPRTPIYDRFGRVTGYNYSPAAKLTPATGTTVFNWTPPGVTSRPRSLLNLADVPGVTVDPVTGEMRMPLSASQRFARDRAELDRSFRDFYSKASAADTALPTQAPAGAATAFRDYVMTDPTLSAQLRLRNMEQTPTVAPTAEMTAARSQFGQAPYAAALAAAFDPFLSRNRAALLASKDMQKSYFERYPDLLAEYEKNWKATMTPEEYASYHYRTLGQKEGRTPPNMMGGTYGVAFLNKGGDVSVEEFISKKADGGDVPRETLPPVAKFADGSPNPDEVPSVDVSRGTSTSKKQLNTLKRVSPRKKA